MTGQAQSVVVGETRVSALHVLRTPLSAYVPFATVLAAAALALHAPVLAVVGGILAGFLTWTFFEYWLHRMVLHMLPRGRVRRYVAGRHILHHRNAEKDPGIALLWVSALVAIPTLATLIQLLGAAPGAAVMSGIVVGYLCYEYAHLATHIGLPPATPWGRRLRHHHLVHHDVSPRHNFAITLPLWDHVFATALSPDRSGTPREARG